MATKLPDPDYSDDPEYGANVSHQNGLIAQKLPTIDQGLTDASTKAIAKQLETLRRSAPTPHAIREVLRACFIERVFVLQSIADGSVMADIEVPWTAVTTRVMCNVCGSNELRPTVGANGGAGGDAMLSEGKLKFSARQSASVKDRVAALELMARYGIGQLREVSAEHVRDRLTMTLQLLTDTLPTETLARLIPRLKDVWSA